MFNILDAPHLLTRDHCNVRVIIRLVIQHLMFRRQKRRNKYRSLRLCDQFAVPEISWKFSSVHPGICWDFISFLATGGVESLPFDHVLIEILDMLAIHDMQIVCTSCKAREKALARCSDCANFLCPNCVTAHRYMRCFENHKVKN